MDKQMEGQNGDVGGADGDEDNGGIAADAAEICGHRKAKVVIVGAGMAGLTAAVKLVTNGIRDILVLEAQDYVGGRIHTQDMGDTRVDMGAMFVHGQVGNPVFEIVQKLGLTNGHRDDLPPYFYTTNKERVRLQEIKDLFDYIGEHLGSDHHSQVGQDRGECLTRYKNQFLQDGHVIGNPKQELYEAASGWWSFRDEINEGVDSLGEVSQWVLATHNKVLEGHQETLIKGGYSKVVAALQALIPEGVIRTQAPVLNVDWTNKRGGGLLVQCANGDVITTDHVIVTVSLGCLKAVHSSMFTPQLPSLLVNTFTDKMRMGSVGKIYLKWDKPFWSKDQTHFDFLWLKSFPVTLRSDKSKRKTRLGKMWWQYVAGPERVHERDNILIVWLSEHQVDAIRDLEDQEVKAVLFELMEFFLFDSEVTMPDDIIRTRWKENPYTRGTYSYPIPSFDTSDAEHMHLPSFPSTQNPRLMFAGEAFTMEYMTNVHGAFIAGEQQADRVLHANGTLHTTRVADAVTVNTNHRPESS